MFENFRYWMSRNQDAVSWFIIGVLTSQTIDNLILGHYVEAAVTAALAYLNYYLTKVRI